MTIDLTKNTTAFGLMSEEEREALEALPKGEVELYTLDGWVPWDFSSWLKTRAYRQRPTPPLIVDPDLWRHLPKWANCIVGQSNGDVYYCADEPEKDPERPYWQIIGAGGRLTSFQSITFADPERWEEAIVKRPEGV